MNTLYHIALRAEWEALEPDAHYQPVSLKKEGFIHLSTGRQLLATAARHFAEHTDLVVVAVDAEQLRGPLRYEEVHGEHFPHLYGPLEPAAILEVVQLPRLNDGSFDVPAQWTARKAYFRSGH